MDRLISLDFAADFEYADTSAGILIPIRLIHGDRSVELSARLDTGASDCLFDRSYSDVLGFSDTGVEREYRTVTGSFKAFGHEVTIETLGLQWPALVFFHAMGNPAHAFVGRRGWLDQCAPGNRTWRPDIVPRAVWPLIHSGANTNSRSFAAGTEYRARANTELCRAAGED